MNMEQSAHDEEAHEGEKYLALLGLGHLADQPITTDTHGTIYAKDFMTICEAHAKPAFVAFEAMDPANPDYEMYKSALSKMVTHYIGSNEN